MKIFVAELEDSRTRPRPPMIINKFLYLPVWENSGSTIIPIIMAQMGVKQIINNVEMTTTILATFWSRTDALLTWPDAIDAWRHFRLLFNFISKMSVQTVRDKKAIS